MPKRPKDVCPGCSRHCPMESVRCKYGRKYFGKMAEAVSAQPSEDSPHYKWEKHVAQGGLAWKLLWVSSRSKKALRRKDLTEQALLSVLDETEQAQLEALLDKISGNLG